MFLIVQCSIKVKSYYLCFRRKFYEEIGRGCTCLWMIISLCHISVFLIIFIISLFVVLFSLCCTFLSLLYFSLFAVLFSLCCTFLSLLYFSLFAVLFSLCCILSYFFLSSFFLFFFFYFYFFLFSQTIHYLSWIIAFFFIIFS